MTTVPLLPEVTQFIAKTQSLRSGGQEVATPGVLGVLNPSSGGPPAEVAKAGAHEVDLAGGAATEAFQNGLWTTMGPDARSRILWRLADLIEERAAIFGQLDALDNGKPFAVARDVDAMWSARQYRHFAGWPDKIEGATVPVKKPDRLNYILVKPVGVCGLITPWNYPLLMASWKLAPALAAGNTVVLKPSEETLLTVLYLADLALEAGLPPGVLNVVSGLGHEAGVALAAHHGVAKVGFAGSTRTGRAIVKASVGNRKWVSLELGGKAAKSLFADADLDRAIPDAVWANFGDNGQSCAAGSRLCVHADICDEVIAGLTEIAESLRVGPGMDDPDHDFGPVISEKQMRMILRHADEAQPQGETLLAGGARAGDSGWFIPPTIIEDVTDDMTVARQEVFGPVLSVLKFTDDAEVLGRAKSSIYGLAAGLWSQDVTRVRRMADALEAGTVGVNCWDETDAASLFGGVKQSGYGRDMGREAIALTSQTKSVWIA